MEQIVITEEVRVSVTRRGPRSRTLEPLMASNREALRAWQYGTWAYEVPDHLSAYIHDRGPFSQAIDLINNVSKTSACCTTEIVPTCLVLVATGLFAYFTLGLIALFSFNLIAIVVISVIFGVISIPAVVKVYRKHKARRVVRELQKVLGHANFLLLGNNIALGTECNSILTVVNVCVSDCREELSPEDNFKKMVLDRSCGYACCLAKEHFPFGTPKEPGHLQGGVCFCQYVNHKNCSCF